MNRVVEKITVHHFNKVFAIFPLLYQKRAFIIMLDVKTREIRIYLNVIMQLFWTLHNVYNSFWTLFKTHTLQKVIKCQVKMIENETRLS